MASIRFHSDIYDRVSVEETISAFDEHGTYTISQDANATHLTVDIEPAQPLYTDLLLGQFANYALTLSIERHRAGL